MMKKAMRAFSMVELMVVVVVVGILSAFAYNSYRTSMAKSRWAEVAPCISEAVNRLENYRSNRGIYPTSDVWTEIRMNSECSEHYEGVINVTNEGENYIVAYFDSRKSIWSGGSAGYDTWIQTDQSGRQIHINNPIEGKTETVPTGYVLPSP